MKVILAGGGTAGHINPAIAIAEEILKHRPNTEVLFVGNEDGMEKKMVTEKGFAFSPMKVKGIQRSFSPENIKRNAKALKYLASSGKASKKILKDFKPDIVIGTGGYVSGPIVFFASKQGIKTVIHEQNAYPGVTTKILAKRVDKIMVATEKAIKNIKETSKCEVTGNPIRSSILSTNRNESRLKYNVGDRVCILSFGGSLGARVLNNILDLIEWEIKNNANTFHIHATGKLGYDDFVKELKNRKIDINHKNLCIKQYINDMDICMSASDLIISRAGAVTVSEVCLSNKGSILIPSPNVSENHQYHNAMVIEEADAGIVIEEKNLTSDKFIETVKDVLDNNDKLKQWGINAGKIAIYDSNERIYQIINKII